jgi:uncharacterized protein (TIGR02246 family)
MSVPNPRRAAWPFLVLLPVAGVVACDQGPTQPLSPDRALAAPEAAQAALATVPPAMERGIHELLQAAQDAWAANDAVAYGAVFAEDVDFVNPLGGIVSGRQAIIAQHVFLFNGPFAGSVQSGEIRRLVALTGTLAVLDVDVTLTGYAGLPPGLGETAQARSGPASRWWWAGTATAGRS